MAKKLVVEIVGDTSSLNRAFKDSARGANRFGGALKTLGKAALIGAGAAFAGLAVVVKQGFDELSEGQKVAAQTGAVLKSTGGIANVTAKEVANLASEQSKLTGIDDELIQSGENLLLTFKNVRDEVGKGNDVFQRATKSALDLSTAGFGSVESASKMMGKALNDPVKGMTALGRAGVTFSEDQKKTIKSMVETGDVLGAQKLILEEVESQVGGSAKAYGETLPGQLAKARNAFDEVAEGLAVKLLPYLTQLLNWVNDHMPQIQAAFDRIGDLVVQAFEGIAGAWGKLEKPLGVFADWVEDNPDKAKNLAIALGILAGALYAAATAQAVFNIAALANPYVALAAGIVLLVGALVGLYLTNERVHKAVDSAFRDIRDIVASVIPVITGIWKRFGDSFIAIGKAVFGTVTLGFRNMLDMLLGIINIFAGVFTGDWRRIWKGVTQIFDSVIGNLLKVVWDWVKALWTITKQAGGAIIEGLIAGAQAAWPRFSAWLTGLSGRLAAVFNNAGTWLYNAGVAIIQGLWDGLKSKWDAVAGWLGGLGSQITSLKGPPAKDAVLLEPVGKLIMQGLQKGMTSGWAPLEKWLDTLSPAMTEKVGKAIDAVQAMVLSKKEAFASAFETLVGSALAAFDKLASEALTKTEKLIARQDEAMANADRMKALADADAALAAARGAFAAVQPEEGEDPQAFANRMGAATAAIVAAEQARADALFAIQRAKDEKKAEQERRDLDAETERKRVAFEKQLGNLKRAYANQEISTAQFQARLIALFKKFEVPLGKAAKGLGAAIAAGLNDSLADVEKAAEAVATAIEKRMNRIKVIITIGMTSSDDGRPPGKRALGGPVRAGQAYLVGELGPELFVPTQSGQIHTASETSGMAAAGGMVVNLLFNGPTVGTSREFEDTVRRALYDVSRRNPGSGLVLA